MIISCSPTCLHILPSWGQVENVTSLGTCRSWQWSVVHVLSMCLLYAVPRWSEWGIFKVTHWVQAVSCIEACFLDMMPMLAWFHACYMQYGCGWVSSVMKVSPIQYVVIISCHTISIRSKCHSTLGSYICSYDVKSASCSYCRSGIRGARPVKIFLTETWNRWTQDWWMKLAHGTTS